MSRFHYLPYFIFSTSLLSNSFNHQNHIDEINCPERHGLQIPTMHLSIWIYSVLSPSAKEWGHLEKSEKDIFLKSWYVWLSKSLGSFNESLVKCPQTTGIHERRWGRQLPVPNRHQIPQSAAFHLQPYRHFCLFFWTSLANSTSWWATLAFLILPIGRRKLPVKWPRGVENPRNVLDGTPLRPIWEKDICLSKECWPTQAIYNEFSVGA